MKGVPARWTDYVAIGQRIPGTRFIAFKSPLRENVCRDKLPEEDWLTPCILIEKVPQLKAVVDLTNTTKTPYYSKEDFIKSGVDYLRINVPGRQLLPPSKLSSFFFFVDDFLEKHSSNPDALLGVHCTHGLNRTGYLICKYMIEKMKIDPQKAISEFETARGHKIERQIYLNDLKGLPQDSEELSSRRPDRFKDPFFRAINNEKEDWRSRGEVEQPRAFVNYNPYHPRCLDYSSPLDGYYETTTNSRYSRGAPPHSGYSNYRSQSTNQNKFNKSSRKPSYSRSVKTHAQDGSYSQRGYIFNSQGGYRNHHSQKSEPSQNRR